jgi:hypothetical protein
MMKVQTHDEGLGTRDKWRSSHDGGWSYNLSKIRNGLLITKSLL